MSETWTDRLVDFVLMLLPTMLVCSVVFLVACVCARFCDTKKDYDYAATGSVVSVDGDDAVYETYDGNLWRAFAEGFSAGDDVVLLFDDNGTPSIYDDEIRRVIPVK